jgi:hypothetical protein
VASYAGRFTEAAEGYATVARLAETAGDGQCVAYVTASAALQHAYAGSAGDATRLAERAARLAAATGNPTAMAWADYALGVVLQDSDPARALAALGRARTVARAGRNTYIPGVALSVSTALLTRHGDVHLATRLAAEVIDYWSHESHWAQQWTAMRHVIGLFTRLGEHQAAATLHGALTASRTAVRPVGTDAELLDADITELTHHLGDDVFAAATSQGATLNDDDAVAFASATLARLSG